MQSSTIKFDFKKVLQYVNDNDLTYKKFARQAGIIYSSFQGFVRQNTKRELASSYNPKVELAYKIAKRMNCSIESLIIK